MNWKESKERKREEILDDAATFFFLNKFIYKEAF